MKSPNLHFQPPKPYSYLECCAIHLHFILHIIFIEEWCEADNRVIQENIDSNLEIYIWELV